MGIKRFSYALLKLYWKIFKPLVLGSRALVVRDDSILLVRLTYVDGWYLPGGGVDRGENFTQAIIRELREECGLEVQSPILFGEYYTTRFGKKDHVAVFVVKDFIRIPDARPDPEIAEMRFFKLTDLPNETTPATRRRIQEFVGNVTRSPEW